MENLALLIYNKNYENYKNFYNFIKNINIFHEIIGKYYKNVNVFIFTNSKNLKDKYTYRIRYLLSTYNYNIQSIKYIDELTNEEKKEENIIIQKYYSNVRGKKGIEEDHLIGSTFYHNYLLNKIKNETIITDKTYFTPITQDVIYYNCFDICIDICIDVNTEKINSNLFSSLSNNDILIIKDILFYGNTKNINYLFDYVNLVKYDFLYHEHIWRDSVFLYNYDLIDNPIGPIGPIGLNRDTYSMFTQYFSRILYSRDISFKNLNDNNIFKVKNLKDTNIKILKIIINIEVTLENENSTNCINTINTINDMIIYINRKLIPVFKHCKLIIDNMYDEYNFIKYKDLLLGSDQININKNLLALINWLKSNNYSGIIMEL
jgi:hypothetical protein